MLSWFTQLFFTNVPFSLQNILFFWFFSFNIFIFICLNILLCFILMRKKNSHYNMQLKFVGAITNIIVMKICANKKSYLYSCKIYMFRLLIIIFLNKQMQVKAFDRIFCYTTDANCSLISGLIVWNNLIIIMIMYIHTYIKRFSQTQICFTTSRTESKWQRY